LILLIQTKAFCLSRGANCHKIMQTLLAVESSECLHCSLLGDADLVRSRVHFIMSNYSEKLTPVSLRKRSGKTQQEIAEAIGRRKSAVSGWEKGRRSPILKIHEIKKFMAAYDATLDELIEAFSNGD